ncbi:ABC transporter substrate-binding protein [Ornithinimicrobium faecis]|uniref:ABC transporter substrate-binding protein n=1 Tax=Ornithinimicrobium faecis TaxID=2934158 RepID=A0ABY4YSU9_9MICO|nr:ABC transporter substrate-binding protein [Ornithinimicrobium sp. HY1793]USQ79671.1 ABC transporter substrate-binding protein [Ornithinimicrobium sp. HY1793]
MTSKLLAATAVVSASALILSACGNAGPGGGEEGELTDGKVVLAVLNDQSGVYKDLSGPNSVKAVEMAVADYQEKYGDDAVATEIEVTTADHQNKPDVANTKAQELYDRENADIILDVPTSSAALAVATQAAAKKKLYVNIGAGTTELTNDSCNSYTFHWAYDTYQLANVTGKTVTENGGTDWQIIYPDYAFGQDMDKSFTAAIEEAGGTIGEHIATPFPNDNFSTFLTKAATAEPNVIGAMQAGGDLINLVKQFNEGGYADQGIQLAVGLMFITDIHSLGVEAFSGVNFAEAWYWNADDENRAWADRFLEETDTRPSFAHAANYSAALQYLEAVQEEGTDDADTIVGNFEGKEINDVFLKNGTIRAEDHRVIHDVYLAKVKAPEDVEEDWDYEEIVSTIPAEDAFMPLEESTCDLG